jgi:hypothetical protein
MKWNWDYQGFGELLCGPEMQALMEGRIDKVAERAARGIAPTDDGRLPRQASRSSPASWNP